MVASLPNDIDNNDNDIGENNDNDDTFKDFATVKSFCVSYRPESSSLQMWTLMCCKKKLFAKKMNQYHHETTTAELLIIVLNSCYHIAV